MLWQLLTDTPAPLVPPSGVPDDLVTPGVWGFVITAAIGIIVVLLIVDMTRRIRRVRYRAEIAEKLDAEEAAAASAATKPKNA